MSLFQAVLDNNNNNKYKHKKLVDQVLVGGENNFNIIILYFT